MVKNNLRYNMGSNKYSQKAISNNMINAIEKIQKVLQQEENNKYGKKAQTVNFAWVSDYVYEKYLKGKSIK